MSDGRHEPPVDPIDIRWKMAVACDVCRRRKVRCDGERPCSRCKKGNRECTFSIPRHIARKTQDPGPSKRSRSSSLPTDDTLSPKRPCSQHSHPENNGGRASRGREQPSDLPSKDHLLLIDPDDQIVYSGPSSGMPLFARLGLLRTVEVSESEKHSSQFASHSSSAFGITSAASASRDYFDMCLQRCPQDLMNSLIGHNLSTPVFFPLLHAPSFLSEFIAVTERRLKCTPQYGAMLMSILAVTAKLVDGGRGIVPAADKAGETYYEFAQDLLRVSMNKLDIRHILALYHLALFAEGRNGSSGIASSFVAEAIGLAFATGLHRSTDDFRMDPVTMQIRTRLFWSLYSLDIALAYSQGRPALIRLSECSIELPAVVDNGMITKTQILPQPDDDPPVIMAAAVKTIEIYIVLEQVLSAINAPFLTISQRFNLSDPPDAAVRSWQGRCYVLTSLPPYLITVPIPSDTSLNLVFLQSSRLRSTLLFVRTLIARQHLIDEFEEHQQPDSEPSESTLVACNLSVDIVKTYSRLRHYGFLQYCSFTAVSHLTAASHTLIACMIRSSNLAFDHRPDLLSAIDMLILFSTRFPSAKTVSHLLLQLSRELDLNRGDSSRPSNEALAIRVLARKMAASPAAELITSSNDRIEIPPSPLRTQQLTPEHFDYDWLVRAAGNESTMDRTDLQDSHSLPPLAEAVGDGALNAFSTQSTARSPLDLDSLFGSHNEELPPDWGDNFSFLNDGLFGSL